MTTALLFGGQGTELPRMGLDLAAELAPARALLRQAGEHAGVDAEKVLSGAGPDAQRTNVVQPLLTAVGLGVHAALAEVGITPTFVAGHSLGEVAAWSVAGAFTPEAAVALAAIRGRAMQREATAHPGRMLAVRASEAQVHECLQLGRTAGSVALAAHNSPSDWTLSGDQQALAVIASRAATTRLPVSGAWHSPAMAGAVDDVCAAARACGQRPVHAQVVVNRTGALAGIDADVAELLAGQLVRPVQWAATMQTLAGAGVTRWLIAGPGTMLRGLLYKNLGRVAHVAIVETFADARALAK